MDEGRVVSIDVAHVDWPIRCFIGEKAMCDQFGRDQDHGSVVKPEGGAFASGVSVREGLGEEGVQGSTVSRVVFRNLQNSTRMQNQGAGHLASW